MFDNRLGMFWVSVISAVPFILWSVLLLIHYSLPSDEVREQNALHLLIYLYGPSLFFAIWGALLAWHRRQERQLFTVLLVTNVGYLLATLIYLASNIVRSLL